MNLAAGTYRWAEDYFDLPTCPTLDRTYTMYHGTSQQNVSSILDYGFRQSMGGVLGCGVYLSRDLGKASQYPYGVPESQRVVFAVEVNVGNVIQINYLGHPMQYTWHDYGFDTAWVPPNCGMVPNDLEENCIWDPKRITIVNLINLFSG